MKALDFTIELSYYLTNNLIEEEQINIERYIRQNRIHFQTFALSYLSQSHFDVNVNDLQLSSFKVVKTYSKQISERVMV